MSQSSKILAILTGLGVPILGLLAAFEVVDLDTGETAAVLALWVATVALGIAVIEHLRADTPEEWGAIAVLLSPEITAIMGVLLVFHAITDVQGAAIMAVIAVPFGVIGIPLVRSNVFSKTTHDADLATARAAALRGPAAGDVTPPGA